MQLQVSQPIGRSVQLLSVQGGRIRLSRRERCRQKRHVFRRIWVTRSNSSRPGYCIAGHAPQKLKFKKKKKKITSNVLNWGLTFPFPFHTQRGHCLVSWTYSTISMRRRCQRRHMVLASARSARFPIERLCSSSLNLISWPFCETSLVNEAYWREQSNETTLQGHRRPRQKLVPEKRLLPMPSTTKNSPSNGLTQTIHSIHRSSKVSQTRKCRSTFEKCRTNSRPPPPRCSTSRQLRLRLRLRLRLPKIILFPRKEDRALNVCISWKRLYWLRRHRPRERVHC